MTKSTNPHVMTVDTDDFIPSGLTLLDCILGGYGYALGHLVTIGGLPASCKTGYALEAVINFCKKFPDGLIFYFDAEARLDKPRAQILGVDLSRLNVIERVKGKIKDKTVWYYQIGDEKIKCSTEEFSYTVEDVDGIVRSLIRQYGSSVTKDKQKKVIFIIDSLDSVPPAIEVTTELVDRGGYRTEKSRQLGEHFRTTRGGVEDSKICYVIIQQVRDNVSGYGKDYVTSGGWAPEFYRSQGLFLKQGKLLKKVIDGQEIVIGCVLHAKCEKNSTGRAYGEIEFDYYFDYGMDNITSNLRYLNDRKRLAEKLPPEIIGTVDKEGKLTVLTDMKDITARIEKLPDNERQKIIALLEMETINVWKDIEERARTNRPSKY